MKAKSSAFLNNIASSIQFYLVPLYLGRQKVWPFPNCQCDQFGDISPMWQNFIGLRQFLWGLFGNLQNFDYTLAIFISGNFSFFKGPNIEKVF